MKDICQVVYELLKGNLEIKNRVQDRIYPILLPEDAPLPAIVYTPTYAKYDSSLQGDTGFVAQTIQFNCHDTTFKKARELSRLVKKTFQDYKGTIKGLNIQAVFIKTDSITNGNSSLKFNVNEYMCVLELDFLFNEK